MSKRYRPGDVEDFLKIEYDISAEEIKKAIIEDLKDKIPEEYLEITADVFYKILIKSLRVRFNNKEKKYYLALDEKKLNEIRRGIEIEASEIGSDAKGFLGNLKKKI